MTGPTDRRRRLCLRSVFRSGVVSGVLRWFTLHKLLLHEEGDFVQVWYGTHHPFPSRDDACVLAWALAFHVV